MKFPPGMSAVLRRCITVSYTHLDVDKRQCVDGISSYPVMKSNHSFDLLSCFPASAEPGKGFTSVTYSQVAFREPESRADQTRLMGIVTTGPETGYYVDVFRSRKERGGDKMHDYFYHNLGQTMTPVSYTHLDVYKRQ